MSEMKPTPASLRVDRYALEREAEDRGWREIVELVHLLTPEECMAPGYYTDPDWNVRDLVAHLGTWLAEAGVQFERMGVKTYQGHEIDIDAMNQAFLAGMADQPWDVTWLQAMSGRAWMLQKWALLETRTDEAAWWIRKSGADHYSEHLDRLREWTAELIERRRVSRPTESPARPRSEVDR
jgi:hypothetical protein